ncbi:cobalt-precorrin-6A reductase [uncultured Methylobacterium sp.]|uniref:cobalt-precorrin-6A reductase n=1 Tax=uncultured Methylobacterium sp. TaxID=157278 RepID=UPI0035CA2733
MRILILGGTGEASALVRGLGSRAGLSVTLSLAGRTAAPAREPVPTRIGGFGGAEGLARYLRAHAIDRLVDATHPFAARISRNAAAAAAETGVPLLAIRRPPWIRQAGDAWIEVDTIAQSVDALGVDPKTVFLTVGRMEVAAFANAPQHDYVVRTIEPLGEAMPVPRLTAIRARGPFDEAAETVLMREAGIAVLVTKNAGGNATYGKIAAARVLGLPVVIVRRPWKPDVPSVADAEAALDRLSGTARG